jgi:hypothetical protein
MITNNILSSSDRELFGVTIKQETKNNFLSVTDLQSAYNIARWQHGWSDRRVNDLLVNKPMQERLFYVLENQGFIKTSLNGFIELLDNQGITKTLKQLGVWKTTGARGTNQVMCNPYIWVLLAMEMNPMIYAKVIVWLTDSLIFNRIEAGDEYKPMNTAITKIINKPDYSKYAILINKKVFGIHQLGMRNLASAKELRKIADIEKFITQSIDFNFLKNDTDITNAILLHK